MKSICVILPLILIISSPITSFLQTNWTKYPRNPVLKTGSPGSWDERMALISKVIYDGSNFLMWYLGNNTYGLSHQGSLIGHAISSDGINWVKYDNPTTTNLPYAESDPVINLGPPGAWDEHSVCAGPVLYDGNEFKMWYAGFQGPAYETGHWRSGLAISPDGINWTKVDSINPALDVGPPGSWDNQYVLASALIYNDSLYKMWYIGGYGLNNYRVGYATSLDGIHWIKYNNPNTNDSLYLYSDPVLDIGLPGSWDGATIHGAWVISVNDTLRMWYYACDDGSHFQTGYATSINGINWDKYYNNPVLRYGSIGCWDQGESDGHTVMFHDSRYKMWFGGGSEGIWQVGYAEDFSLIPHSDSIHVNLTYARPVLDTLVVRAHVVNRDNHSLKVETHIKSKDLSLQYTIGLVYQGNNVWEAQWPVSAGEREYKIGVKTFDLDSLTIHNGMWWNPDCFTTIGPLVIDHFQITSTDTIPHPGDYLNFKLTLRNDGSITTAPNISASLTSLDSCARVMVQFNPTYGDIDAGASATTDGVYRIRFYEIFEDSVRVPFQLDIASHDTVFWTANFSILVKDTATHIVLEEGPLPSTFSLSQNYPNPFNPSTIIEFNLPKSSEVTLKVFNILGEEVGTLVSDRLSAGSYSYEWDASNLASGVYLYKLQAGDYIETRKMMLMR